MATYYLLTKEIDEAIYGIKAAATHRYNLAHTETIVSKLATDTLAKRKKLTSLLKDCYVMDEEERRATYESPEWSEPSGEE